MERDNQDNANGIDTREALFNSGETGRIDTIQVAEVTITRVRGILFDLDPGQFRDVIVPPSMKEDPAAFYDQIVRPWLQRQPILADARVIVSGRGLHVVPMFDEAVELTTDGERRRWSGIVRTVQAVLPTDPAAPGITATTRAIGSKNGKNGKTVTLLQAARPVAVQDVLAFFEQIRHGPFQTVTQILFGSDRVAPCPRCRGDGSALVARPHGGKCYKCGKAKLDDLYDIFLSPGSDRECKA
jgi:hypothetical protein